MPSFCAMHSQRATREFSTSSNPDVYTSAGLVAYVYPRFETQFWLDRIMLWLTVFIPMGQAVAILVLHAVSGVARCVPHESNSEITMKSNFVDQACGLHLSSQVLKGLVRSEPLWDTTGSMQLQHECYPFVLLITALIMVVPHFIYRRAIDRNARRDMCLVRSEMHSFRRAVGQELQYLQSVSAQSVNSAVPANTLLSPGSTMPQGAGTQTNAAVRVPVGGQVPHQVYWSNDVHSGGTTAATLGANTLLSDTPAPTVVQVPLVTPAVPPQIASLPTTHRCGLFVNNPIGPASTPVALGCGDADFSAPGLLDLPCFQACHADWSLNTYLSAWQNTDFYWRRYLTKHAVLGVFQTITLITLVILIGVHHGAPFAALFHCELHGSVRKHVSICTLQTTFVLNMSVLSWAGLAVTGLVLQAIYFYSNFIHPFWLSADHGRYLGVDCRRPWVFSPGCVDETYRCFFADYIHLLAYTAFRDTQCEIRSLSVSYSPGLYRSDFHFISLLCIENAHLIPDALHVHFWTERYARLCRRRFRRPYWAIRRGSLGHLVRCEDLSMKFNFSKIRVKVEVNDFGF
ncbi:hypothetical protein FBUS_01239 [Fasciolopsis buskii]|uniref:Uncharacterized protein n=1 Tax=Fasciolopsis buskii TaxID=27845 RepID=A0A8E0S934_9TREM|nr:hypothetical protein FBUS_01239 [Fasciolopsis buski]